MYSIGNLQKIGFCQLRLGTRDSWSELSGGGLDFLVGEHFIPMVPGDTLKKGGRN